ncbi:MAG: dihydrolipoyl dehydrogenase [Deltaproteobacteria bacterium]|nr:dihydrolipoyl dehydrogenase [Deltaproteobacteria bacterium]
MTYEKGKTKLAIVGAGPGGYAAAFYAADLGLEVTLIDVEKNPGGVCLYRGCIPSKALLHASKVVTEAGEASRFGIDFGKPKIDPAKLQAWKEGVVGKLTGGLGQLVKQRKVAYIQGRASFIDSTTLKVFKEGGGDLHLAFDHCILATGSRPSVLFDEPLDSPHLLNSTDALALNEIPKNMLVIGGGYIGLELGTVYATLGTRVSLVELSPGYLPGVDRDLVLPLARRLEKLFADVRFNTKVVKMRKAAAGVEVEVEGPIGKKKETYEKVLMAVGRKPNTSGLGLDTTKVELDEKGFVKVDAARRSADPALFAIGDITGEPMLAHKASHEARAAVDTIAGKKGAFEPQAIPAVVFTDPEIAWCGLTEEKAKKDGKKVEVARFPWAASGRALTLDRPEGVTKLIIDPESERLLGVGICGAGAGELISEGVLAIEMGATASDLKFSIHPHPTLSETLMEAAETFFGQATHVYKPKR